MTLECSPPHVLRFEPHRLQAPRWPATGRHVLAQFDANSIVVYQAYQPAIADYAFTHQRFGGEAFSYSRMSWIKPNFLWMMFRAGWAAKPGQERILAVWLAREFFDDVLAAAVPSSFDPARHATREDWAAAVAASDVRLQWDPDHDPAGAPLARRAVQLGLRGETLRRYGHEELRIEDITPQVIEQRTVLAEDAARLCVPAEAVYRPRALAARNVGLDDWEAGGAFSE